MVILGEWSISEIRCSGVLGGYERSKQNINAMEMLRIVLSWQLSINFITAMQGLCIKQTQINVSNALERRRRTNHLTLLTLFPFFPSNIPSNFLLRASLTLLCPAHSLLSFFIRQLANTMKPTALSDGRFRSVLPSLPRRLSPRRRRGEDRPGVMPISERRLRSISLLCGLLA